MGAAAESPGSPTTALTGERGHARMRARAAAAVVDGVVLLVVCAFLPQPFPPVLPLALLVCYQALATWWLRASVGKVLLGLRVVRLDGDVTLAWALLRAGPGYLVLTVVGLGWALAAIPPDRRPLHDRVLGADVVMVETAALAPRQAAVRLADWARRRQLVAERKGDRTRAALAVLWAWLAGLGAAVQRFIDWLRGADATGPSAVSTLSTSAAATISGFAAAGVAVLLAPVPPLADAAAWLVEPRYWAGAAPEQSPGTLSTQAADEPPTGQADLSLQGWWAAGPSLPPFSQVLLEFVPRRATSPPSWDVLLRSGPDTCAAELGQVVARVQHVTGIDGRPLHPKSRLQVTESNTECSSLWVTDTVYADAEWPVELTVLDGRLIGHAYTTLVLDGERLSHGVTDADIGEVEVAPEQVGPDGQIGQTFERTRPR